MADFDHLRGTWEMYGYTNPFWSVITCSAFDGMQATDDDAAHFYETGVLTMHHIAHVLATKLSQTLHGKRVCDYGCGVGRLTSAMLQHHDVEHVVAMDVSRPHLKIAAAALGQSDKVSWVLLTDERIPHHPVDVIVSIMTLQHLRPQLMISTIEKLLCLLVPKGIAILHIPYDIPEYDERKCRRRSQVMEMHCIQLETLRILCDQGGCKIAAVDWDCDMCGSGIQNAVFYIVKLDTHDDDGHDDP